MREIANAALAALSRDFASLYWGLERPSMAPEKLLRAMLWQAFYSERRLMERMGFDLLLFRWFVSLASKMRCGTIRASRRTVTGFWRARLPPDSWPPFCRSRGCCSSVGLCRRRPRR
jgi:hypothetical protein